jgi:dTDP-4-dehydrorhamnose 3,5-epimerase
VKAEPLRLKGALLLQLDPHADTRGWFVETWNKRELQKLGIEEDFVQDNQSGSHRNVLRGLHYQEEPHPQAKLVRCVRGAIFDVIVDLRPNSSTFGSWDSVYLREDDNTALYVPKGFAHGFLTFSDWNEVCYKCSDYWYPECAKGLLWNDPKIGIRWPATDPIVSDKDRHNPPLSRYGCMIPLT